MFSEAAEIIFISYLKKKKEEEGKEGDPVMLFGVSLPIPNGTVLRIFLGGKYWTVFMPHHPIALTLMSWAPVLPSNITPEAEFTTKRMSGIQNPKFLLFSTRNDFPSSKGTATTQLTLPRVKSLSKMSSAQPLSPGLDLN